MISDAELAQLKANNPCDAIAARDAPAAITPTRWEGMVSDTIDAQIGLIRKCLVANNAGAAVERIDYVKAEITRLRADLAQALKDVNSYGNVIDGLRRTIHSCDVEILSIRAELAGVKKHNEFLVAETSKMTKVWSEDIAKRRAALAEAHEDVVSKNVSVRELESVLTSATRETLRAIRDRDDARAALADCRGSVTAIAIHDLQTALAEAPTKDELWTAIRGRDEKINKLVKALAEAERERDIAQTLYATEKNVCSEWIASARRIEADLAAARDVIESYYASGFCPECLMGQPCQPNCTLSKTSAFLERTATVQPQPGKATARPASHMRAALEAAARVRANQTGENICPTTQTGRLKA